MLFILWNIVTFTLDLRTTDMSVYIDLLGEALGPS